MIKEINELQEQIIKADIKNDEKIWKNIDGEYSLEALLNKMTKDELVKVAKKYSVRGITTLKKADAVERLKDVIVEKCADALELTIEEVLNFIESLIKDNGIRKYQCEDIVYSNFLRNRGIAFTGTIDEELFVIIPEEVLDILKAKITNETKEKAKLNGEIIKAIAGMSYYYGVLNTEIILDMIQRVFTISISDEYIKELINVGEELGLDYVLENESIYHIDVDDVENIIKLQETEVEDYYKFDKKTLIKAGEPDFIEENKQGDKLKKALSELFVIDKEILQEEMDCFMVAIKNELSKEEAIETFLEAYEIESEEEKEILIEELTTFANSIRRWTLKGYTEDEKVKNDNRVVNTVRIGRNDPCNCGSGKKYKKCCGK